MPPADPGPPSCAGKRKPMRRTVEAGCCARAARLGRLEERYPPRHLSRDLLVLQKLIECPANNFVAFACSRFQPLAVDDLDSSASIAYEALRLQRLCGHCHARSAQP